MGIKPSKIEDIMNQTLHLVETVWKEIRVPQDLMKAILIPNPKKGNLHIVDN